MADKWKTIRGFKTRTVHLEMSYRSFVLLLGLVFKDLICIHIIIFFTESNAKLFLDNQLNILQNSTN